MIVLWLKISLLIFMLLMLLWCIGALIGEFIDLPTEKRQGAASPQQLKAYQARRELDVAHERLRLRSDVERHLHELEVEFEQERRRRSGGWS